MIDSLASATRSRRRAICQPATILVAVLLLLLLTAGLVAAQDPTPAPATYVVKRGDTLVEIAQRFGTTVEALAAANDIRNPSLIVVGQKLIIPTSTPAPKPRGVPAAYVRVHPVRPGETLPALAFRYGTTIWALSRANALHRLGLLWPGQELTIPADTLAAAIAPGFPEVSARPGKVVQGNTLMVEVNGAQHLDLKGAVLGQDLAFVEDQGGYWALLGVDALTRPGAYPLVLTATEVDSGDRLAMRETFTVTAGSFGRYNVPVPADRQALLDPALGRAERKKLARIFGTTSPERLWDGKFGLPLQGEVYTSAPFGQRRSYAGGPVSSYHTGQDYSADRGTPVYAPITGTVVLAEPLKVRGNAVILDHGLGVFTGFWHLSKISVTPGQLVGPGQVVGRVGNTGLSTGPHLHWEMRVHDVPVNPLQWTRRPFP